MPTRILTDKDAQLEALRGKTCAVLGFGAQGHAHALNLRDSGMKVIVGLPPSSKTRAKVKRERLPVMTTAEAVRHGDVIFLALPDSKMPDIYRRQIAPHLSAGQCLLFAHGFAIHYETIVPSNDIDVVMVAPLGLGPMVRREFVEKRGVPALVAIAQNATRHARKLALAWAKGIGCTRAGVMMTTFREETETDLFSEQAVLCGGMTALVRTGFETLVEAGYAPEMAYYECLHELKFLVDLMHQEGIGGMRALISDTAQWGDLTVGPRIIGPAVKREMKEALRRIQDGEFARDWLGEARRGHRELQKLLAAGKKHPIEKVGARLREKMSWRRARK